MDKFINIAEEDMKTIKIGWNNENINNHIKDVYFRKLNFSNQILERKDNAINMHHINYYTIT